VPRPFIYDFRRTLISATVIAVIIITVVLSAAFVPYLRSSTPGPGIPSSSVAGVAYYDNSTGVNVLAYSFNQFGQSLSGTKVNVTAQSGSTTRNVDQGTNGSGYVHITISLPYPSSPTNNSFSVSTQAQGGYQWTSQIPPPTGAVQGLFSDIAPVIDSSNSSKIDVAVFYAGTDGSPPTGVSAYFAVNPTGFPIDESSMTLLGRLTSYFQIFQFPKGTNINQTDSIYINLFDSNGNQLTSLGAEGYEFTTAPIVQQQSEVQSAASSFVGLLLGLFVPLMAVLAAYSTYGKDRVSGVLESVLTRPVSRRGLAISRFASTALAMVVAVVLTIFALDIVVDYASGYLLTWDFMGTTIGALSVEATAFVGIMFVLSRVIRSGGGLVGIGVGLWAILELFWTVIVFLIAYLLNYGFGSAAFYRLTVDSSFFNPAQYFGLISSYTSSSIVGLQFNPADYGLTPYTIIAAGVLWVALPFFLFLYLAVKKD